MLLPSVALGDKAMDKLSGATKVRVEVDMLGTDKEPLRTEPTRLSKKGPWLGATLSFTMWPSRPAPLRRIS